MQNDCSNFSKKFSFNDNNVNLKLATPEQHSDDTGGSDQDEVTMDLTPHPMNSSQR